MSDRNYRLEEAQIELGIADQALTHARQVLAMLVREGAAVVELDVARARNDVEQLALKRDLAQLKVDELKESDFTRNTI